MNGNGLFPIGSECIKKFGPEDLNEDLAVEHRLFRLLRAIQTNRLIKLTSQLFFRKLLLHLYERGPSGRLTISTLSQNWIRNSIMYFKQSIFIQNKYQNSFYT